MDIAAADPCFIRKVPHEETRVLLRESRPGQDHLMTRLQQQASMASMRRTLNVIYKNQCPAMY